MNPAIEYLVRNNIAKDALQFPCSLFLNHLESKNDKMIITITWHKFSKSYLIRHWTINRYNRCDLLPNFVEYSCSNKSDLFVSDKVILPCYMIEFKIQYYQKRIYQRHNGSDALTTVPEYQEIVDNFSNPTAHKHFRRTWLWGLFLRANNLESAICGMSSDIGSQMENIKLYRKNIWNKWQCWQSYFDFKYETATELAFLGEYSKKVTAEIRRIKAEHLENGHWFNSPYIEDSDFDILNYSF